MLSEKRQYYRLRYPISQRPTVDLLGQTYPVCEISEQGMRLLFRSTEPVSLGVKISGVIHFFDHEDVEIEGIPLRQHDCEVAIKLSKGLSLKRMTDEQLNLLNQYPGFYSTGQVDRSKLN